MNNTGLIQSIQYKHNNFTIFIVGVARINLNNVLRAYENTRMIPVTMKRLNK